MTNLTLRLEKQSTRLFPDRVNCFIIRNTADSNGLTEKKHIYSICNIWQMITTLSEPHVKIRPQNTSTRLTCFRLVINSTSNNMLKVGLNLNELSLTVPKAGRTSELIYSRNQPRLATPNCQLTDSLSACVDHRRLVNQRTLIKRCAELCIILETNIQSGLTVYSHSYRISNRKQPLT